MHMAQLKLRYALVASLGIMSLFVTPLVAVGANASVQSQAVQISLSPYDPENAPPSKYIKKVTETKTTENLNLRKSPSTSLCISWCHA